MSDLRSAAMDWDTYGAAAYAFRVSARRPPRPRLFDVASGNGAVIETLRQVFAENDVSVACLDSSASAIPSLTARYPFVECIVGDARDMPLPDKSFDIATSQIGVEYAGTEAINDMARVVARAAYDAAVKEKRPIFPELESILERYGDDTAGGILLTLNWTTSRALPPSTRRCSQRAATSPRCFSVAAKPLGTSTNHPRRTYLP